MPVLIKLTKMDGKQFYFNASLIYSMQEAEVNGKKVTKIKDTLGHEFFVAEYQQGIDILIDKQARNVMGAD